MIAIVDYGVGNIKAFANIYKNFDISFVIAKSAKDLDNVSKVILPGVGSFDHAMKSLINSGMRERLDELVLQENVPVLGVCVGLQMLAKSSDEGSMSGLGWIDGDVKKFDSAKLSKNTPLPHMGWNSMHIEKESPLLKGLNQESRFYFLHSYFIQCVNKEDIVATANYGEDFACVIQNGNIYGIQPHPEKSHQNGITLLKNFGEL